MLYLTALLSASPLFQRKRKHIDPTFIKIRTMSFLLSRLLLVGVHRFVTANKVSIMMEATLFKDYDLLLDEKKFSCSK